MTSFADQVFPAIIYELVLVKSMLSLDDSRWGRLVHAYGSASDIPALLGQLETPSPYEDWKSEPYFSLWSSLFHQGDVYTASYAALPHLVDICQRKPATTHWSVLGLAIHIEIARHRKASPPVPDDLIDAHLQAISCLVDAAVAMVKSQRSEQLTIMSAAAMAVATGQPLLGEAICELDQDTVNDFLAWLRDR